MQQIFLNEFFARRWQRQDPFAAAAALEGECFRAVAARRTSRIVLDGHGFFLKRHTGVGWREIFKNLLQGKLPVLGAGGEYRALHRLHQLGVPTMTAAAFGERGWNPARQESFLITEELCNMLSLEELTREWAAHPPEASFKYALIRRLAWTAGKMLHNGVNHRDCYLCHFLWDRASGTADPVLYVIDLHRAQLRRRTPFHYRVKDLAGLYFSAMDAGLSRRDLARFIRSFSCVPLRQSLREDACFWRAVDRTAHRLYRKIHHHTPPELR